jgi:predicted transcriptional regulator
MMSNHDNKSTLRGLTTEIVIAYLRNHAMAAADVPVLVATIARELGGLGREPEKPAQPEPVVSLRRSVQRDHLVCLICGKKLKSLRRHLTVVHHLTPAGYRETFGLRRDYPIVAPAYAEQRSEVARRTGLGRRGEPEPALASQEEAGSEPSPEPASPEPPRGRRATRKAQASTDAAAAPKSRRGRRSSREPTQAPPPARRRAG